MKFINRLLSIILIIAVVSCDNTEFDLQDDPNAVTAENASVNDLYNNIQLTFSAIFNAVGGDSAPGQMARMYHNNSYTYQVSTSQTTFNGLWFNAYSNMFPDIDALLTLTEEKGLAIHSGSALIMKAYTLMALVDLMGNVPFLDAGQGTEVISPAATPGDQVYQAADDLLTSAINLLSGTTAALPSNDNFYGGDAAKWVTCAKSLRLRAAITKRLIDPSGSASTINALVSEGDLIDEAGEDFQFNFGQTRNNPNSRHPFYNNHYETGDGTYIPNYYMWLLRADKIDADENLVVDPRIRYYFYRKVDDAVGQDQTTYGCHFSNLPDQNAQPAHYAAIDPRLPYCVASEDGYSGRDFLNGEGIPPDGPTRTSYGLYPGGGQFDDNTFDDTRQSGTTGGLGQGIHPIMLASFTDFMRAEAALMIGTNDDPRALLESGMQKSIAKVKSFGSLVAATLSRQIDDPLTMESRSVEELFVPTDEDVQAYIDFVLAQYDAAGDKDKQLDIVMKEYLIALYGNGLEAYNMYRRTGKPDNMAPALEPEPGEFIRSFFLPDVHVNRNATASQKSLSDRVFWDDGSIDLY